MMPKLYHHMRRQQEENVNQLSLSYEWGFRYSQQYHE